MQRLKAFFHKESAASLTLLTMTLLAMVGANSPFVHYYDTLHSHNAVLIINEGLMALFFLCIGIEIKHEIKEGHLKTHAQRMLPLVAAFGGMAFPAAIYSYLNWGNASMRGWAIPTATDIAFSLGVLGIFGKRISPALRIFLMSIAVFDDLMAIIVIAIFYTKQIYWQALVFAAGCCFLLLFYNRKAASLVSFLLLGCALWVALLDSGISPTLSGVLLGLSLPCIQGKRVLQFLHVWVTFLIVPLFVFANAGVTLGNITTESLTQTVTMGIAGGLFFGKQIGIFLCTFLLIRLGLARMPSQTTWLGLYGVSLLCGIGFTMSLFIGSLAFTDVMLMTHVRLGVIIGSLASAAVGTICIAFALKNKKMAV